VGGLRRVGVDAAVEEEPAGALELLDDEAHGVGGLDADGLGVARGGNERQNHHVRVGIQKNIFDELIGAEAAQIRAPALAAERAGRLWRPFEGVGGCWAHPGAGRVDEMALDVEDELVLASDRCLSERRLERGLLRDAEEAAAPAGRRALLVACC
jgi:hypothetical protein